MAKDETEQSVVHLLHRAAQTADAAFIRAVRRLTPRQFAILKAVAASEDLSQSALMSVTGIDRSTISSIVRLLESWELLARKRVAGTTRTYAVTLTDRGRGELGRAIQIADKVEAELLKRLPVRERAQFLQSLALFSRRD
jgi:DNA-binding MarR family transcriptional regulator